MLSGMSTAVLFTYLLGAILLIAGISNLGDFFAIKRKDSVLEGKVTKSVHKERRDDKNNLIQYYYELIVRYEEDRKIKDAFIKSDVQYLEGESVKMVRGNRGLSIYSGGGNSPVAGLAILIAGIFVVAEPKLVTVFGEKTASYDMGAVLIALSIAIFSVWYKDHKRKLEKIEGKIQDVVLFQTDKDKRHMIAPKNWYPVIAYEADGVLRDFIGKNQSSMKSAFKIGGEVAVYRDPETGAVVQNRAHPALAAASVIMFAFALYGIVGTMIM
ncbi:MAG: hypothetical protein K5894_01910 [Lachnospiraceae bacterium]|nr:hypothetical protein [Lachnospiraceae bacterium]